METENPDFEYIADSWHEAVAKLNRQISIEKMNALWDDLFKNYVHPGSESFRQFIKENGGSTLYHALTNHGLHVVYCRATDAGIWFIPETGIGIMHRKALKAIKEIVGGRQPRSLPADGTQVVRHIRTSIRFSRQPIIQNGGELVIRSESFYKMFQDSPHVVAATDDAGGANCPWFQSN